MSESHNVVHCWKQALSINQSTWHTGEETHGRRGSIHSGLTRLHLICQSIHVTYSRYNTLLRYVHQEVGQSTRGTANWRHSDSEQRTYLSVLQDSRADIMFYYMTNIPHTKQTNFKLEIIYEKTNHYSTTTISTQLTYLFINTRKIGILTTKLYLFHCTSMAAKQYTCQTVWQNYSFIRLITPVINATSQPGLLHTKVYSASHRSGSVKEYQLQLGRQRQVWLIPIADERVGLQVNWDALRTRAIPEHFCGGDSQRRGAISSVCTFTFTFPLSNQHWLTQVHLENGR